MAEETWKTAITKIEPNNIMVRGYPVHELMEKVTFAEAVYLILKGELPTKEVGKVMNAILVSSIDHGPTPPSVLAARTIISGGSPLNAGIAGGILAISRYHGGAIEDAMRTYLEVKEVMEREGVDEKEAALRVVREKREKKVRISGFGHRYHTNDPRTKKLIELAEEADLKGTFVRIALSIEEALKEVLGKHLPLNVDGAIGALLLEMGFPPELGNAFFIMARTAGLVAHAYEEMTREKPMRRVYPDKFEYDGPEERHVPS